MNEAAEAKCIEAMIEVFSEGALRKDANGSDHKARNMAGIDKRQ